jgi:type IV pilus assembly protein PilW
MTRHSRHGAVARAQRGFTLMELLMVSLVGGVVIAGTLAMYVKAAESAAYQNAASRVQESGRFALDHMARTLRMAGYDNPANGVTVSNALQVFDPNGADFANQIDKGKKDFVANNTADAIQIGYEGALSPEVDSNGNPLQVVDCNGNPVAQGTAVTNTYVVSNKSELLCHSSGENDALYAIADGIEDMRIWYGVDLDSPRDFVANQFVTPPTDWSRVVAVRIALLVNSVEDVFQTSSTISDDYRCESCSEFTLPPIPDDPDYRKLRAEFHATVRTRSP